SIYDRDLLGTNIAPTSLDSSVAAWAEVEWIPRDGPFAFLLKSIGALNAQERCLSHHCLDSLEASLHFMAFPLLLSAHYPPFWKVVAGQGHNVAEIPSRPRGRMTPLLMRPWRNCNAIDGHGRAWYDNSNLAMFVWLSSSAAPMPRVTALASPSHLCAQNDSPGHVPHDGLSHVVRGGLDFNLASPIARVTALPLA
ncbi:unnamed protein product, partial [Prunus brigantina]